MEAKIVEVMAFLASTVPTTLHSTASLHITVLERYVIITQKMMMNICDRAWENRSYLHVKFHLILRV